METLTKAKRVLASEQYMNKKIPRYLQRIKTFYNPLEDIIVETSEKSQELEDETRMSMTTSDVEELLKKYSNEKVKFHALEPRTFGGTISENARDWIKRFDNYTKLNKTAESDKLIMFESLLVKSAICWYTNLGEDDKKTWTALKKTFEDTYFNSNSWVNSQRIENRKLKPGENCANYINDLIELAQLTGLSDSELNKAILRGLPNNLRHQVVAHNPQTINETVQRVLLTESMINEAASDTMCTMDDRVINNKIDNFVSKFTSSLSEIEKSLSDFKRSTEQTLQTQKCATCGRLNHTTENCYFKNNFRTQFNSGNGRGANNGRGAYNERGAYNGRGFYRGRGGYRQERYRNQQYNYNPQHQYQYQQFQPQQNQRYADYNYRQEINNGPQQESTHSKN